MATITTPVFLDGGTAVFDKVWDGRATLEYS
jgi:hypothetical protein